MDTIANNEFAIRTTTILGSYVAGYFASHNYGIDSKIGVCNSNIAGRILSFMAIGGCASFSVGLLYDNILSIKKKLLLFGVILGFSSYQLGYLLDTKKIIYLYKIHHI